MSSQSEFDASGVLPVSGRWRSIRLHPDIVTGEVVNIGVVFVPNRGQPIWKLLHNTRGLECMYGPEGVEQFGFLLKVLFEHLSEAKKADQITTVSPQVSFGKWHHTAGDDAYEILDHFYRRIVKLSRASEAERIKVDAHSVNTMDLRKTVQSKFNPEVREQLFRKEPVLVVGPDRREHYLDMPVWMEKTGFFPHFSYGTIVSCHYKNEIYRKASLGPACQHMQVAIEHFAQRTGTGFLIALRPEDDAAGFTRQEIANIENEIDDLTWPFQRHKNVRVHVAHNASEVAKLVEKIVF